MLNSTESTPRRAKSALYPENCGNVAGIYAKGKVLIFGVKKQRNMSPERKKLIERAVLNKVRRELFQHRAPLSVYALADRIREVEVEITSDFETVEEIAQSEGGVLPINLSYELEFDDLLNIIQESNSPDIFLHEEKVGLRYFWELEIFKLTESFLKKESKIAFSRLIDVLTSLINSGTTILTSDLLQKSQNKEVKNKLEQIVIGLINQYPKIFAFSEDRSFILFNPKADLLNKLANFAFSYGESRWEQDDRISIISKHSVIRLLNESDYYFKDYQKPLEKSDIDKLIKSNGNWFEDKNDLLVFRHLSPVRELLKANYQSHETHYAGRAIIVFYYIGEDFPIKEAEAFVKLKRVIHISSFSWNHTMGIGEYLNPEKKRNEFWSNLKMILPKDIDFKSWVSSNIAVSKLFPSKLPYKLEEIYPEMILYYSPILNLDDNPGNLFKLTIEDMLKQTK